MRIMAFYLREKDALARKDYELINRVISIDKTQFSCFSFL